MTDDAFETLINRERREDYPDTDLGTVAYRFAGMHGVSAAVKRVDGRDAAIVRIDPTDADLQTVHLIKVDEGLTLIDEQWYGEASQLIKTFRIRDPQQTKGWYAAADDLAALAADHSPAETLDYWILHRGPPLPEADTQSAWAEHRGVSQQAVSANIAAVRGTNDETE